MSLTCNGIISTNQQGTPQCSVAWIDDGQNVILLLDQIVTVLQDLNGTLQMVFNFDVAAFELVLLASIISFITGHVLGVVVKFMNRA